MVERVFLLEFSDRAEEVDEYIRLLKIMERKFSDPAMTSRTRVDRGFSLARASAFLILYNAIEASARAAISAIYDEIGQKQISFDELRATLRAKIISDTKNNLTSDDTHRMRNIAFEIVTMSFAENKLFNGNVDAKEIRKVADRFGLDLQGADYSQTAHGSKLVEIKNHRNDLAHGSKSFIEVGRNYTTSDIEKIAQLSLAYMHHVLSKVDEYLDQEGFRVAAS
ncbi:hypothetical protein JYT43_00065 [Ahrensia sp. AH-315-G08]|nr:hypothetical protein [Ahrensia sp. AH-315-G08]